MKLLNDTLLFHSGLFFFSSGASDLTASTHDEIGNRVDSTI